MSDVYINVTDAKRWQREAYSLGYDMGKMAAHDDDTYQEDFDAGREYERDIIIEYLRKWEQRGTNINARHAIENCYHLRGDDE